MPKSNTLRALLRDEPGLLQSICNIYMQDFICLGYELPPGCELLPTRASTAPPTMGITPEGALGEEPPRHNRRKNKKRHHKRLRKREPS